VRPRGHGLGRIWGSLPGNAEIDQVGRAARGAGRHLAGLPPGYRGRGLRTVASADPTVRKRADRRIGMLVNGGCNRYADMHICHSGRQAEDQEAARQRERSYGPSLLAEAGAAGKRVRCPIRRAGPPASVMCPCDQGRGRVTHGRHGRGVRRLRPHASPGFSAFALPLFRMPARCRRLGRFRARRLWCEGIGDALVGGVGLTVDAVGVDLEQDGDGVPGAGGDLGRGHPEFSHSDIAACRWSGSVGYFR
jgi:hypothetical protein